MTFDDPTLVANAGLIVPATLIVRRAAYRYAARLTTSVPERHHLLSRATHLSLGDRPMDRPGEASPDWLEIR